MPKKRNIKMNGEIKTQDNVELKKAISLKKNLNKEIGRQLCVRA